jgi:two-component sensor histidine kinase
MEALEGRVIALAGVHTILALTSWKGAEIRKLVDQELSPYYLNSQVVLEGKELQLEPTTAQTLALAFHELATNSAKYGALSTSSGRLFIKWQARENQLEVEWKETGGPTVQVPTSRGFGTRSVIASIETQLGGVVQFDWRTEGVICGLRVPLEIVIGDADRRLTLNSHTG